MSAPSVWHVPNVHCTIRTICTCVTDYIHILSDTHSRCKELSEQNGFTVLQPLVLCLRNDFGITLRQTINPVPSQGDIIGYSSKNYASYYRWNGLLLRTPEHNILEQLFIALKLNIQSAQMQSRVEEAVSGFFNPFSSSFEDNEVYFLSFGVPAKPGIA